MHRMLRGHALILLVGVFIIHQMLIVVHQYQVQPAHYGAVAPYTMELCVRRLRQVAQEQRCGATLRQIFYAQITGTL